MSKWRVLKVPGRVTLRVLSIEKRLVDIRNRPFTAREELRIIPEGKGYRLDKIGALGGTWLTWEPVTDTVFNTVSAAKREAREYTERVDD